jgi:hypothetical protein
MKSLKQSLRKKPTYDELINYLEVGQPKIKYPDRTATFLRNSPYLSIFDNDSFIDLEEQENRIEKEKLKEAEVKRITSETQGTAQVIRTYNISTPNIYRRGPIGAAALPADMYDTGSNYEDAFDDAQQMIDDELDRRDREIEEKQRRVNELIRQHLQTNVEPSYDFLQTPDRPSAPPATTPITPRRLEEEFETPSRTTTPAFQSPELDERIRLEGRVQREKRAQDAKAKAITKKEEEHKTTLQQLSKPYQSTSSSAAMPHGLNPVPLPKYFKNITEVKKMNVADKTEQLQARGIKFSPNPTHKELNEIIDKHKNDFLNEDAKQREQKTTAWTQSSSSKKK